MSDFIVKDANIFFELKDCFIHINQSVPPKIQNSLTIIQDFIEKIKIEKIEYKKQIEDIKKEIEELNNEDKNKAQGNDEYDQEKSRGVKIKLHKALQKEIDLNNKSHIIGSSLANFEHLITTLMNLEQKTRNVISDSQKGINALTEMGMLAQKYLSMSMNYSGSSNKTSTIGTNESIIKNKIIGNTMHRDCKKGERIDQMQLNSILKDFQNSNTNDRVEKLSINNVSQFDFSILEKNGFKIQETGSNTYSAYKEK